MGAAGLAQALGAPQPASQRAGLGVSAGPGTTEEAAVLQLVQGVDVRGKLKSQ